MPLLRAWRYGALALLLPTLLGLGVRLAGFTRDEAVGPVIVGSIGGIVAAVATLGGGPPG